MTKRLTLDRRRVADRVTAYFGRAAAGEYPSTGTQFVVLCKDDAALNEIWARLGFPHPPDPAQVTPSAITSIEGLRHLLPSAGELPE